MKQDSREKIALIVFSITVVIFVAAVIAYMVVAHSWNIAARSIDEHRGSMEGYTVFLYPGDQPAGSKESNASDSSQSKVSGSAVSVDAVKESYLAKGAQVLVVDSLDPSAYEGDDIYSVGGKRAGVFFVGEGDSLEDLIVTVEGFSRHKVDFLLCIATDPDFVLHDSSGIDAVLIVGEDASIPEKEESKKTLFALCPQEGSVGAIMLSPDGVVSSKSHAEDPDDVDDVA